MIVAAGEVVESPATLRPIESDLLATCEGIKVYWVGRGATALLYAYTAVQRLCANAGHDEVILPAIACPSLALMAIRAGLVPRYADVDAATGMVTVDSLKRVRNGRTAAAVVIHLYGNTAESTEIAGWCRAEGILLIEDNAQALGASHADGTPVGCHGDFSVYSFSTNKILEAGCGALVARTTVAAEAATEAVHQLRLPSTRPGRSAWLGRIRRDAERALIEHQRRGGIFEISPRAERYREIFASLYVVPFSDGRTIVARWPDLGAALRRRSRKAELYDRILSDGCVTRLNNWQQSGVCWRYSALLNTEREFESTVESIRRNSFHVSSLFWPLNRIFSSDDACPDAEYFARRVINLWVDDRVSEEYVLGCATLLRRIVEDRLSVASL